MKYVYPGINNVLMKLPSFYRETVKDKEFRKKWESEREKRLLKSNRCEYCNKEFNSERFSVLHHRKMPEKEEEAMMKRSEIGIKLISEKISGEEAAAEYIKIIDELMNYYKSLSDTDLICLNCHEGEHPFVSRRKRQRRLG